MQSVSASQTQQSELAIALFCVPSQDHSRTPIRKTKTLSCKLCRQRKIKCDRAEPCSHCVRTGAVCVSSTPSGAPRGRQRGRHKLDSELFARIAKLENLVERIEGVNALATAVPAAADGNQIAVDGSGTHASKVQPVKPAPKAPREGLDRYLGSSLWMNLSDEIHGMREVLAQLSDDEDNDSEITRKSSALSLDRSGQSDFVICAPDILPDTGSALKHPTRSQVHSIYSLFMTNVDPAVKILHGPSLRRYLIEGSGKLDCSAGPGGWEALEFAIYYSTTTSLTPEECLQRLGEEKAVLLARFRSSTELALARADFVNTEEMSTLQALVLYLFAVRSNESSRRTWTLTSLAIRIAHALGLHRESVASKYTSPLLPFEREMRRRLWWQICVLDRQACVDRGSEPIITTNSFTTQLPLHVNDKDLIPDDPNEVQPRKEYTDTTFCLVCHEVFDVQHRLTCVPAGEFDCSRAKTDDPWSQRIEWVVRSQRRIEEKYLRHCNVTIPVQRYTILVADIITAMMWLFAYRPLRKHPDSPTLVNTRHPDILHLSVEVMEKAIQVNMDTSAQSFGWISCIWVQWHALAVTVAELCVQTEGPTVERAWKAVNMAFEQTAQHVADSNRGRLWRPIKKLMSKAQAIRKKHLEVAASQSSLSTGAALNSINQTFPRSTTQLFDLSLMETETEPTLLSDASGLAQQLQSAVPTSEPMPINWDQWLATPPSDSIHYNNELNQMAWTNWETFIDDFQAYGGFPPAEEGAIPPPFNTC